MVADCSTPAQQPQETHGHTRKHNSTHNEHYRPQSNITKPTLTGCCYWHLGTQSEQRTDLCWIDFCLNHSDDGGNVLVNEVLARCVARARQEAAEFVKCLKYLFLMSEHKHGKRHITTKQNAAFLVGHFILVIVFILSLIHISEPTRPY